LEIHLEKIQLRKIQPEEIPRKNYQMDLELALKKLRMMINPKIKIINAADIYYSLKQNYFYLL